MREAEAPETRFWAKVGEPDKNGCRLWTGAVGKNGYGVFCISRRRYVSPHRYVWALEHGEIPKGQYVGNRCGNQLCVNHKHLWAGSPRDVILAHPDTLAAKGKASTRCPHGHERTPENTIVGPRGRTCRVCIRIRARRYYRRKKAGHGRHPAANTPPRSHRRPAVAMEREVA